MRVDLRKIDPSFTGKLDEKAAKEEARCNLKRLSELQELLYAEHKHALLVCLQAIDAGGKDSTIRTIFGAMNPQGCRVHSFKQPTSLELDHDFLWRAHMHMPAKGEVAVFNRSHYEDVLVTRVHKLIPEKVLALRYEQINAQERIWSGNGTHILKFFLHISRDEQLRRFKKRIEDPTKQWKVNIHDFEERAYWDDYQKAFEAMLSKCSTVEAPWFVIPANHKWFRNLLISRILVSRLEALHMRYPSPAGDIKEIRRKYFKRAG